MTVKWVCTSCGQTMDANTSEESKPPCCPFCGTALPLSTGEELDPAESRGVSTLFQPGIMAASLLDEIDASSGATTPARGREAMAPEDSDGKPATATELFETEPASLPIPFLSLDAQPYLLILGADPGAERRPLLCARTTLGREDADVGLDDDTAVSRHHCQIEAFGDEFYLRDLKSRNGTFLNGEKIRYSQLMPGDQITMGRTTLIFRTSIDPIGRH